MSLYTGEPRPVICNVFIYRILHCSYNISLLFKFLTISRIGQQISCLAYKMNLGVKKNFISYNIINDNVDIDENTILLNWGRRYRYCAGPMSKDNALSSYLR
jgi:hypothetical protein